MPIEERIEATVEDYTEDLRAIWRNLQRPGRDRFDDNLEIAQITAPLTMPDGQGRAQSVWDLQYSVIDDEKEKPKKDVFKPITDCDCECASECEFDGNEAQICFDTKE